MDGTAAAAAAGPNASSFTNTFLKGILTSIDSKDPVVANAWLETLLDAIDLLPPDVIVKEIVVITVSRGQLTQPVASRKSACRLLGKIASKLPEQLVRQEVLPSALSLCQDPEPEVKHEMCRHFSQVAVGVGSEVTKTTMMPQLVDLAADPDGNVRIAAVETVVKLLNFLDAETVRDTVVPMVIESGDRARAAAEDPVLAKLAHFQGQLCHGLATSINPDQRRWFLDFYRFLAQLGSKDPAPKATASPNSSQAVAAGLNSSSAQAMTNMPDLLPVQMQQDGQTKPSDEDLSEMRTRCRYEVRKKITFDPNEKDHPPLNQNGLSGQPFLQATHLKNASHNISSIALSTLIGNLSLFIGFECSKHFVKCAQSLYSATCASYR